MAKVTKIIRFNAKCSDMFSAIVSDENGEFEFNGRVPKFLGGGDYVELTVDLETGQILNWKKPTDQELYDLRFPETRW